MGLALSPVVGVIVGALSTILAALLGLNDTHFSNAKAVRIGSFGFACVAGALCGVFIRVNSFLAPDIKSQYDAYTEWGYSGEEARSFIAYQRFGILDKEWSPAPGPASGEKAADSAAGASGVALAQMQSAVGPFSAESLDASDCETLADLSEGSPLAFVTQYFETAGGFWATLLSLGQARLDPAELRPTLLPVKDAICEQGSVDFGDENCAALGSLGVDVSAEDLRKSFTELGGVWQTLAATVSDTVTAENEKIVLEMLVESACSDDQT